MSTRTRLDVDAIGTRAFRRRMEIGLEQLDVAEKACMSRAYVSRLENGGVKNPKVEDLAAIAGALDISLDQLVYGRPPADLLAELPSILARVTAPEIGALLAEAAVRYPTMDDDDRTFLELSLQRLSPKI